jgi:hypothetical protein
MLGSSFLLCNPQGGYAQTVSVPLGSNIGSNVLSSGFGDQTTGFSGQVTVTGSGAVDQFQSVTTSINCPEPQAEVRVHKQVTGLSTGQLFPILISENAGTNHLLQLQAGNVDFRCVSSGFVVQESGFNAVESGQCEVTAIIPGTIYDCTLTNTISGFRTDIEDEAVNNLNSAFRGKSVPGTEAALGGTVRSDVGSTAGQATPLQRPTNPPTGACVDWKTTDSKATIRTPSSMKILINGKVNLDKVRDALYDLKTNKFHVAIASDLKNDDGILSAVAAPQFMGYIIVQDEKGLQQKIIKYNILDFRRECSYITLAKAAGPATNADAVPLGELGDPGRTDLQLSDIDRLLVGGERVVMGAGPRPLAFNPPFSECHVTDTVNAATGAQVSFGDNFAIYNIRGHIDPRAQGLNENNLLIQATVDLNQEDIDLAKIVGKNNPLMRVDLLTREDRNTIDPIKFTLTDVWTDCKQIALSSETELELFVNELNY